MNYYNFLIYFSYHLMSNVTMLPLDLLKNECKHTWGMLEYDMWKMIFYIQSWSILF